MKSEGYDRVTQRVEFRRAKNVWCSREWFVKREREDVVTHCIFRENNVGKRSRRNTNVPQALV